MDADGQADKIRRLEKEAGELQLKLALSERDRERLENHLDKNNSLFKANFRELDAANADREKQIVERKLAMEALRDSEEKYRILLEESSEPIFSFYPDGQYRYVNRAFANTVGKKPEDIIGKKIWDVFLKEEADKRFANVKWVCENGESKEIEVCVPRPDGDRYFITMANPVLDDQGRVISVICISKDITGRKQAEIELRQAKEQAESATKLKDKFVALVSHDLRSPIAMILGSLNLLRDEADSKMGVSHKTLLEKSVSTCEGLIKMIDQLLDISRLQTGSIKPDLRFMDARSMASQIVSSLAPLAERKGVTLINETKERMRIHADYNLIYEVISNLVTNAIKFTRAGDTIGIFFPADKPGAIAVKDTGVGIPPHIIPNLFHHEVKTTTTGTAGERGAGLGLPFCKDIMNAHGGSLTVESEKGKGSLFCAVLPIRIPVALVVDDDADQIYILSSHMKRAGINVVEAANGLEALDIIRSSRPDVVITDINMPDMDGIELITRLKEAASGKPPPAMAVTASRDKLILERAFSAGAADVVTKPVDENEFIPRVNRLLMMTDSM